VGGRLDALALGSAEKSRASDCVDRGR
jgi:hypothetical protein